MERKSNIELLRIVCMLLIILWHINIGFGGDKELSTFSLGNILNSITVMGVNCFVLISGYFGIRFNWGKLVSLIFQCLFYSVTISFVCHKIFGESLDFKTLFLPISSNVWWFMTVYVMLYLSAPFLNKAWDNMNSREKMLTLLSLVVINVWFGYCFKNDNNPSGHSYLQFVFMYIAGKAISCCKSKNIRQVLIRSFSVIPVGGGILMLLITLLINMFFIKSYRYNNPLVIISAISLFLCFLNLNIGSVRKINLLSSTVVAAYLIHEHPFVRPFLAGNIRQIHDNFCGITEVCIFLLIAVGLILISFIIERVRLLLMNPLLDFVFYKIGKYKNNKR